MKTVITIEGKSFKCDLSNPLDISLTLRPGNNNPNCYYSPSPEFTAIRGEGFIGSVEEGGVVNHKQIIIAPHGNGTHTECYGHISPEKDATIDRIIKRSHLLAEVITVEPVKSKSGDYIIMLEAVKKELKFNTEAVIIRTTPNSEEKKQKNIQAKIRLILILKLGNIYEPMK